ncbi:MAG: SurA N-terminal domain-containing protein [Spirochaetota bacterium]
MSITRIAAIAIAVCAMASAEVIDRVLAVVNDDAITLAEFKSRRDFIRMQMQSSGRSANDNAVLDEMIRDTVLRQQAKKHSVSVSESEIDARVNDIMKQNRIQTKDIFEQMLKMQTGTTMRDYREQMRSQLLVQNLFSMVLTVREPSDEEAEEYFRDHKEETTNGIFAPRTEVRLAWIQIAVPVNAEFREKSQKNAVANEARAAAAAGKDMNQLARKYSDDTATKMKGGELGTFSSDNAVASPAAMFTLEQVRNGKGVGWVSDIQEDRNGFWFVKVLEVKRGGAPTFRDVKAKIKNALYYSKAQKEFETWLDRQVKRAAVKRML